MYLVTQSKKGISSLELGRRLGVAQTTAWTIKHKLAQVMSDYAAERFGAEVKRLYGVLDRRLGEVEYVAGEYSIADMAIFPWVARFGWQGVDLAAYPNVKRWYLAIAGREAVQRGCNVPKTVTTLL